MHAATSSDVGPCPGPRPGIAPSVVDVVVPQSGEQLRIAVEDRAERFEHRRIHPGGITVVVDVVAEQQQGVVVAVGTLDLVGDAARGERCSVPRSDVAATARRITASSFAASPSAGAIASPGAVLDASWPDTGS